MKYDLEISVTDILTQNGKNKLANIFFPNAINRMTALFNDIVIDYPSFVDISKFNTIKGFNNLVDINPLNFKSHIKFDNDVSLAKVVIKRGSIIPFFYPGTLIFHKYPLNFANDALRLLMDYDSNFDRYYSRIPSDIDFNSLTILTSKMSSGGLPDIDKQFKFISEDTIDIIEVVGDIGKYRVGTIIIHTSVDDSILGIYATTYSTSPILIFDSANIIEGTFSTLQSSMVNGTVYVNRMEKIIVYKSNNKFYDYRHKLLFKKSKENYKFTISTSPHTLERTAYLNCNKLDFVQPISVTVPAEKSKAVFYNKYPAMGIIDDFDDDILTAPLSRRILKNLIRFTNDTQTDINVTRDITGSLYPIISYRRINQDISKNIKHMKVDVSPKSINFGDGVLCFMNAEAGKNTVADSINVDYGNNYLMPMSSKQVKVTVLNADGVPIPNKVVKLTLLDDINGLVKWGESADANNTISGVTDLSGEFMVSLISSEMKFEFFIQKEWVGDITGHTGSTFTVTPGTLNKVYIPYDITVSSENDISTFIVTADDPITGQISSLDGGLFGITSEFFDLPKVFDFYENTDSMDSYGITGRRIAYVELSADQQIGETSKYTVRSTFIRPISMDIVSTVKEFYGRKLFKYDQNLFHTLDKSSFSHILTDTSDANFTAVSASEFTISSIAASAFNNKWLLTDNLMSYFKFTVPVYTELTYQNQLPDDDNIVGYLIKVNRNDLRPNILIEHNDEFVGVILSEAITGIELLSAPQGYDTFTLSTEEGTINSYIGPYSHLSLSDYLENPYGTNYSTYVCRHSSRIISGTSNRCSHATISFRTNYLPAPSVEANLYCARCPDYDNNHVGNECPGREYQLINPFVFYTSQT